MKRIVTLLIALMAVSIGSVQAQDDFLPIDPVDYFVRYIKVDTCEFDRSALHAKVKDWISNGWKSYKDVVSFESEDKFILNTFYQINKTSYRHRITVEIKDYKYRISIDNISRLYEYRNEISAEMMLSEVYRLKKLEKTKKKGLSDLDTARLNSYLASIRTCNALFPLLLEKYSHGISKKTEDTW